MLSKVLNYFNLFKVKPIDESLLAKKVDSIPQPVNNQITDSITSPQADVLKAAVEEKIAPEAPAAKPKKTTTRRKKTQ